MVGSGPLLSCWRWPLRHLVHHAVGRRGRITFQVVPRLDLADIPAQPCGSYRNRSLRGFRGAGVRPSFVLSRITECPDQALNVCITSVISGGPESPLSDSICERAVVTA